MHSLNHPTLARATAAHQRRVPAPRAVRLRRRERPPNPRVRARAAYAAGRLARHLDREMARRAVV